MFCFVAVIVLLSHFSCPFVDAEHFAEVAPEGRFRTAAVVVAASPGLGSTPPKPPADVVEKALEMAREVARSKALADGVPASAGSRDESQSLLVSDRQSERREPKPKAKKSVWDELRSLYNYSDPVNRERLLVDAESSHEEPPGEDADEAASGRPKSPEEMTAESRELRRNARRLLAGDSVIAQRSPETLEEDTDHDRGQTKIKSMINKLTEDIRKINEKTKNALATAYADGYAGNDPLAEKLAEEEKYAEKLAGEEASATVDDGRELVSDEDHRRKSAGKGRPRGKGKEASFMRKLRKLLVPDARYDYAESATKHRTHRNKYDYAESATKHQTHRKKRKAAGHQSTDGPKAAGHQSTDGSTPVPEGMRILPRQHSRAAAAMKRGSSMTHNHEPLHEAGAGKGVKKNKRKSRKADKKSKSKPTKPKSFFINDKTRKPKPTAATAKSKHKPKATTAKSKHKPKATTAKSKAKPKASAKKSKPKPTATAKKSKQKPTYDYYPAGGTTKAGKTKQKIPVALHHHSNKPKSMLITDKKLKRKPTKTTAKSKDLPKAHFVGNLSKYGTPTPAESAKSPTLAKNKKSPTLAKKKKSPTLAKKKKSPTLAKKNKSPTLAKNKKSPTLAKKKKSPTLAKKNKSPVSAKSAKSPTPTKKKKSPTPAKNKKSPTPAKNKKSPTPAKNKKSPTPAKNKKSPTPAKNKKSPPPAKNKKSPPLAKNKKSPPPAKNKKTPTPVKNDMLKIPAARRLKTLAAPKGKVPVTLHAKQKIPVALHAKLAPAVVAPASKGVPPLTYHRYTQVKEDIVAERAAEKEMAQQASVLKTMAKELHSKFKKSEESEAERRSEKSTANRRSEKSKGKRRANAEKDDYDDYGPPKIEKSKGKGKGRSEKSPGRGKGRSETLNVKTRLSDPSPCGPLWLAPSVHQAASRLRRPRRRPSAHRALPRVRRAARKSTCTTTTVTCATTTTAPCEWSTTSKSEAKPRRIGPMLEKVKEEIEGTDPAEAAETLNSKIDSLSTHGATPGQARRIRKVKEQLQRKLESKLKWAKRMDKMRASRRRGVHPSEASTLLQPPNKYGPGTTKVPCVQIPQATATPPSVVPPPKACAKATVPPAPVRKLGQVPPAPVRTLGQVPPAPVRTPGQVPPAPVRTPGQVPPAPVRTPGQAMPLAPKPLLPRLLVPPKACKQGSLSHAAQQPLLRVPSSNPEGSLSHAAEQPLLLVPSSNPEAAPLASPVDPFGQLYSSVPGGPASAVAASPSGLSPPLATEDVLADAPTGLLGKMSPLPFKDGVKPLLVASNGKKGKGQHTKGTDVPGVVDTSKDDYGLLDIIGDGPKDPDAGPCLVDREEGDQAALHSHLRRSRGVAGWARTSGDVDLQPRLWSSSVARRRIRQRERRQRAQPGLAPVAKENPVVKSAARSARHRRTRPSKADIGVT